MKKTILASASVFALTLSMAAPAVAQLADPTPPATPIDAPLTPQCDGVVGNCSLVEQDGTSLQATVTQSNTGNVSDIQQIDGSAGAIATVTQSGTNATSFVGQSNSGILGFPTRATVSQSGDGASSTLVQIDSRNHRASVTQDGASESFLLQELGLDTSAEVTQSGGTDNTSVIFQLRGNGSQVGNGTPGGGDGVVQIGSFNNSEVYQGDFSGAAVNNRASRARIRQEGNGNDSILIQNQLDSGNGQTRATVAQTGDDNESSIIQTGIRGNQDVDIIQTGNGNLSRVEQQNASFSPNASSVAVTQTADDNISEVTQSGPTQTATVDQTGNDNSASVIQTGSTGVNDADINQDGSGGFADISQTGTSGNNTATVTQEVTAIAAILGNTAEILQFDTTNSDADITQRGGSDNAAVISQGDASTVPGAIVSGASDADADITQDGSDNLALVVQVGGLQNAQVVQTSSSSTALVDQGALSGSDGDVFIDQIGTNDYAEVAQNSSTNTADIDQAGTGDLNEALVSQGTFGGGDGNLATISQTGGGNLSVIGQNDLSAGGGNIATVTQNANNNQSFVFQDGSTNTATVNQLTDGNLSTVIQNGTGNTVTVNQ